MAGLTIMIAGGSEERRDDDGGGVSPGSGRPGGDGVEVDIPASHCTLPSAMPEAKPGAPPTYHDALPRFDEHVPRPVPPIALQEGATLTRLVAVMRRLLAPDGCPWDREQTFETLRKYVLEEACEVIDAIDSGDRKAVREELGDLLLQVVFQAELARREESFAIDDVVSGIVEKLVHRHPHVFGDLSAKDADEVLRNWEKLKAKEKGDRGILGGVPRSMPALTRSQRIGEKVARVGFDWADARGSRAKVAEELGELDEAIEGGDAAAVEEEMGDVLFALVNLSRHLKVDAEGALRRTIDKFTTRFAHVEKRVREVHGGWGEAGGGETHLPLEVLDRYWEEAKRGD
jgi:tetrapyrrole methylase family protein/MazG family protein/ATP diphosphatase